MQSCLIYTRLPPVHPLAKNSVILPRVGSILRLLLLYTLSIAKSIVMVTKYYIELRYNSYCIVSLSKMLLLVIMWSHLVGAQSNGDVRVVQNPNDTFIMIKDEIWGRLEMYLNGEWGTLCIEGRYPGLGFNSYVADAACRQLGYRFSWSKISKASDCIDLIPLASNSTTIHIGLRKLDCDKNTDGVFSHILNCFDLSANHEIYSTCTHDDDIIIGCSDWRLEGYDTELFLNSEALNSPYRRDHLESSKSFLATRVVLYLGDGVTYAVLNLTRMLPILLVFNWATLVLSRITPHLLIVAKIVYTDIWLDGVTCGDNPYRCLDACFCYPQTLTAVPCDLNNVIALTCTFDVAKQYSVPPGSRDLCEDGVKTYCAHPNTPTPKLKSNFIIVSAVLSIIIVLLCLVVVGLMVMMWNRRGRAQYQTINQ